MCPAAPNLPCQMKCLPKVNCSRTAENSQIQKEAHRFSPKCFLDSSGPEERGTKNIPVPLDCGYGSPNLIWKQKERRKLLSKGFHGNECLQKTLRIKSKRVRTDAESKKKKECSTYELASICLAPQHSSCFHLNIAQKAASLIPSFIAAASYSFKTDISKENQLILRHLAMGLVGKVLGDSLTNLMALIYISPELSKLIFNIFQNIWKKMTCMLDCIRRVVASRESEVILLLCSALIKAHLQYCGQLWRP